MRPDLGGRDRDGAPAAADGGHDGAPAPDGALPAADSGLPDATGADGACVPTTACDHVFTYPAGGATSVEVRGDFKTDGWTSGVAMTLAGTQYSATINLTNGATVHYKLVLNGTDWVTDPANPNQADDGYGGFNSVLTVDCGGCTPTPPATFDWRDAVMYFVLVDRFADGDPTNNAAVAGVETAANYQGGDLAGVLEKINDGYFTALGVNTLWLSSPVDNTDASGLGVDGHLYAAYHGYWPSHLDVTETRVGTLDLLKQVVAAAHAAGLKVVLDYVMHHVHQDSPVYAAHADWFWPLGNCVCGQGCSWDNLPDRQRCWFMPYLPTFDFQVDAARQFSVANAIQWAQDSGADGFRLDAVKHIETSWISDLRSGLAADVETGGQTFYLVGETYTGDRGLIKQFVSPGSMLNGQFDFPLRAQVVKNVLMRQGSLADLDGFIASNDGYYGAGAVMGTFLGNHDLPRAIHLAEDAPLFSEWDDGKTRAWQNQPALPGSRAPFARVAVAYGLLMTLPGVPLVYYGDEIGMPGAGDPDNRRAMQWTGLSADQQWLQAQLTRLTQIRAAHSALRRGTRHTLGVATDAYVYEMTDGTDHVIVALNRGDAAAAATGLPAGAYHDLVADVDVTAPLQLPPRSVTILIAR